MDPIVIAALVQAVILIYLASRLWTHPNKPGNQPGVGQGAPATLGGQAERLHVHTFLHASLEDTAERAIRLRRSTCGAIERRELPTLGHQQLASQPSAVSEP